MASIRALTWNVWGLNEEHLAIRTRAVAAEVASVEPDLVFLQEIVPASERAFQQEFARVGYSLVVPPPERRVGHTYYVGVAVRDASADIVGACTDDFPGTRMRRQVLSVRCIFRASGLHVDAMTSHFESEGNTRERQAQALRTVELMTRSTSHLAIFGGDTNLRENEAPIPGGHAGPGALPQGLFDAWEDTGSCEETKHTKNIVTDPHPSALSGCGAGVIPGSPPTPGPLGSPGSRAAAVPARSAAAALALTPTPSASAPPEHCCRYDRIWFCAGSRLGLAEAHGADGEGQPVPLFGAADSTPGHALLQGRHVAAAFGGYPASAGSEDISPRLPGSKAVVESPNLASRRRSAPDDPLACNSGGPLQPLPPQSVAGGAFFSPPPNVTARRLQLCPSSVKKPHLMFPPLLSPPMPVQAPGPEAATAGGCSAEPPPEADQGERWFDEEDGEEEGGGGRLLVCASARGVRSPALPSSKRWALRTRAHTAPAGQIERTLLTTDPVANAATAAAFPTAFSLGPVSAAAAVPPPFFSAQHRTSGLQEEPRTICTDAADPAAPLRMPTLPEEEGAAAAEASFPVPSAGFVGVGASHLAAPLAEAEASRGASEMTRSVSTPGALGGGGAGDSSMLGSSQHAPPLSQAAALSQQQQQQPAPASFAAAAPLPHQRSGLARPARAARGGADGLGFRPAAARPLCAATPVRATSALSQQAAAHGAGGGGGSGVRGPLASAPPLLPPTASPLAAAAAAGAAAGRPRWRARKLWLVGMQPIDAPGGEGGAAASASSCFSSDHRGVCAEIVLDSPAAAAATAATAESDGDEDMGAAAAAAAFARGTPRRG